MAGGHGHTATRVIAPGAAVVTLDEARAWLRLSMADDDGLIAGLIRSATATCEAFIGQLLIVRACRSEVMPGAAWQRLGAGPVRTIETIAAVDAAGAETMLPEGAVARRIDASGDVWIRAETPFAPGTRLAVRYRAGIADEPNGVPEPLRQGIIRLVAHLYAQRDAADAAPRAEPPAAVTALWRPWRRLWL